MSSAVDIRSSQVHLEQSQLSVKRPQAAKRPVHLLSTAEPSGYIDPHLYYLLAVAFSCLLNNKRAAAHATPPSEFMYGNSSNLHWHRH